MCERQSPILTNESALISRHIPRSVPDQGMLINQQQAQQEHHTMISQEAEVPIPTQGMTPNQPRRRSNSQYPSPTVITTARFEFAPAAPQYVETHSTYATYAVNSRLSQFIGHSDLTLFQPDHHFSTGLTQQCYQQFAYANTFAPPPQQMGIPSTPIVTIESQQNTISGTSYSIHQQNYLESPSPQTAGADPQFCYPSHEDLVFLSQLDGSGSHSFLLHQSDSYEFREHS
ncbi:16190_t:CDS:1 [Funneliformis mosseae]|uniref:16190_t:CDS:1 n=1 Tax=Funneliformis mosseae TaxID=27381 RepID=A0A9N8W6I2_FUNMO|nr:16190_t:CDS:1 [Funneliformis mosseae]